MQSGPQKIIVSDTRPFHLILADTSTKNHPRTAKMKKAKTKHVLEIAVASAVTSFWTTSERSIKIQSRAPQLWTLSEYCAVFLTTCLSRQLVNKYEPLIFQVEYLAAAPPGVRNKPVKVSWRGGNRDLSICLSVYLAVCLSVYRRKLAALCIAGSSR